MQIYVLDPITVVATRDDFYFTLEKTVFDMRYNPTTQTYDIVLNHVATPVQVDATTHVIASPQADVRICTGTYDSVITIFDNVPVFTRTYTYSDGTEENFTLYIGKNSKLYYNTGDHWTTSSNDGITWETISVSQLPEPIKFL